MAMGALVAKNRSYLLPSPLPPPSSNLTVQSLVQQASTLNLTDSVVGVDYDCFFSCERVANRILEKKKQIQLLTSTLCFKVTSNDNLS